MAPLRRGEHPRLAASRRASSRVLRGGALGRERVRTRRGTRARGIGGVRTRAEGAAESRQSAGETVGSNGRFETRGAGVESRILRRRREERAGGVELPVHGRQGGAETRRARRGGFRTPRRVSRARSGEPGGVLPDARVAGKDVAQNSRRSGARPGALAVVAAHVHDPNLVSAALVRGEESWDAQWEDAVEALRACGRALPGYHKAHYRVAWATLKNKPKARGAGVEANLEAMGLDRGMFWARSALAPLFKTNVQWSVARGAPPRFAVNMTEIDNRNPNPWRGPTARRTIRAEGTFKLTSVGTNESPRKFVGAVRRALRMYLCVCFAAEDLAPLAAAPAYPATRGLIFPRHRGSAASRLRSRRAGHRRRRRRAR